MNIELVKVFKNEQFGEMSIYIENGKEYFDANQVAKVLGYKSPKDTIRNRCKGAIEHSTLKNKGGYPLRLIPEGDLYRLIIGSQLESASKFETWVFDEVLPSIRKHGIYATDNVIEDILKNPDYGIRLLENLKEERNKRLEAENKLEEAKPKILFADSVSESDNTILIRDLAKLLKQNGINIGEKRLFAWLRDNGYLIKQKGQDHNSPTQKSMDLKLFRIKETAINTSKGVKINKTPKVTGKGQNYFINKFLV